MKTLNKKTRLLLVVLLFSLAFLGEAIAEDTVIDQDTSWQAGTYTYDNVLVTNGAILTFNGVVSLSCSNLTIHASSHISADGKGHPGGEGPGTGTSGA